MKRIKDIKKQLFCIVCSIFLSLMLTAGIFYRVHVVDARVNTVQKELAAEVFRFHVIANSDSQKDQQVKLQVRDAVIRYMETMMPKTEDRSAETTKRWVAEHQEELERVAKRTLRQAGFLYGATAEVVKDYFPEKTYGDIIFPEGEYEAFRLKLGNAEGHNWWCVLYPGLCFTDQTCAVVDEDGKKALKDTLTAEEYEMVTATTEFKVRCFFLGSREKRK